MISGIDGGITTAIAPDAAIKLTAKRSSYPFSRSAGNSSRPTAATVPTAEPDIAPKSSDDAIVVSASEPRTPPTIEITHTMMRLAMPPRPMISPAKMKNGIASSGKLSRLPKIVVCTIVGEPPRMNESAISAVMNKMR